MRFLAFLLIATTLFGNVLEDTECDPSALVNGVCTISGYEPIRIRKQYISPEQTWQWFSYTRAFLEPSKSKHKIYLSEPNCTSLSFKTKSSSCGKRDITSFYLEDTNLEGYCNTSRGYPSGRHNLRAYKLKLYKNYRGFELYCPDGTVRIYKCIGHIEEHPYHFLLTHEKLPNGNCVIYDYKFELKMDPETVKKSIKYFHTNGISRVRTTSPSQEKIYAWAKINYSGDRDGIRNFTITTSDQQNLSYWFKNTKDIKKEFYKKTDKQDHYLLTSRMGSVVSENFDYYLQKIDCDPLLSTIHFPNGFKRYYDYHRELGHDRIPICGQRAKIKNKNHDLFGRVKGIKNSSGAYTHGLFHEPHAHRCTIYDAEGHHTC